MSRRRAHVDPGDITLRPGVNRDTQYLFELYARGDIRRALGLKLPIPAVDWRRILDGVWESWKPVWIIMHGPLNVGHVGIQARSDPDRRADIVIAVDPAIQGRGVGSAALAKVIAECDGLFDVLIARMPEGSPAVGLFRRFGFEDTGRIPRYYRESEGARDQIIMSRVHV